MQALYFHIKPKVRACDFRAGIGPVRLSQTIMNPSGTVQGVEGSRVSLVLQDFRGLGDPKP